MKARTLSGSKRSVSSMWDPSPELSKTKSVRKGVNHTIDGMFEKADKSVTDLAVARLFYGCGLAFNLIRQPYFRAGLKAIAHFGPSYVLPSYEALRTTLLETVVKEVKSEVTSRLRCVEATGMTILSDGWSSTSNRPLMNSVAVCPDGVSFVESWDTTGQKKTGRYTADLLLGSIAAVGPENVVQVITDSASSMRRAGKFIQEEHPHIFWTPCAAHQVDLLLESIGELEWVAELIDECKKIVTFVSGHHASSALFQKYSELQLLKPGETRFATCFIMLERVVKCKAALQHTVADDEWEAWLTSSPHKVRGEILVDIISSSLWWRKVSSLVKTLEPAMILLRLADSDKPSMGKIYNHMLQLRKSFAGPGGLTDLQKGQLIELHDARKEKMIAPLHIVGYVLDPEHLAHQLVDDEHIGLLFLETLESILTEAESDLIGAEWVLFKGKKGLFGSRSALNDVSKMEPADWWSVYGLGAPTLKKVALRVLSQVSSSGACERNWSTFDFIHSKKRNRLSHKVCSDLVYVFSNLRFLDKAAHISEDAPTAWLHVDSESENSMEEEVSCDSDDGEDSD